MANSKDYATPTHFWFVPRTTREGVKYIELAAGTDYPPANKVNKAKVIVPEGMSQDDMRVWTLARAGEAYKLGFVVKAWSIRTLDPALQAVLGTGEKRPTFINDPKAFGTFMKKAAGHHIRFINRRGAAIFFDAPGGASKAKEQPADYRAILGLDD